MLVEYYTTAKVEVPLCRTSKDYNTASCPDQGKSAVWWSDSVSLMVSDAVLQDIA